MTVVNRLIAGYGEAVTDSRVVLRGGGEVRTEIWDDAPTAVALGPDEILIAPDAVGICGTDIEIANGTLTYIVDGLASLPVVPGHEWTGLVLATGSADIELAPGDRVVGEPHLYCGECDWCASGLVTLCPHRREVGIMNFAGAMATKMVFPARHAYRISAAVHPADAALIEPLAVAYRAIDRLAPSGSGPLLVVGCGTLGCLTTMVTTHRGIDSQVVDPRADRLQTAIALGATAADSTTQYRYVIDTSGSRSGFEFALERLAPSGRLLCLGLTGSETLPVPIDRLVVRDQTIVGSLGSAGVWPDVIQLVETKGLRPGTLVTHRFGIDAADRAFRQVAGNEAGTGKVIVVPG